jgi:hypothetical protein
MSRLLFLRSRGIAPVSKTTSRGIMTRWCMRQRDCMTLHPSCYAASLSRNLWTHSATRNSPEAPLSLMRTNLITSRGPGHYIVWVLKYSKSTDRARGKATPQTARHRSNPLFFAQEAPV